MLNDDEFIKTCDVPGPTKEEIRAILLYKSNVCHEDIVVDIGCGTGGLSVEFSLKAEKVYSIDKNPEAINICKKNLEKLGNLDKVSFIENDGVNALKNINTFDIALIGGSGRDLEPILDLVDSKLNHEGRILIPCILVDTKVDAVNKLKSLGYNPKIVEVNVSKGRVIDRGIMMIARNPIAIVYAKKR
ncbi:MAG: precorrin-6Y C5,15-methyltransferase (decarboxylating) subunit CbiT [Methanobacteriaceae archaeon]|jgi:cobalt-precorrin-6B (C15)-methyltransferase|uniref:precorrin-6Y C5,15-methyltransferase (decarboxylating) subunit CbiT n=1 Tax=Methanobrevibacter TaxID=2172 RepID=UPI00375F855E|nr:precorrin-6Y C5,15-methyltransferase (decarboxylating) subunit CbiT [Methanobacteriaceae archaeon]MDD4594460.1 precorrin-6Y C5,15-methyltransferase (decarboxylating) subunit CbiT [Methanobacteriaceae archaeon]